MGKRGSGRVAEGKECKRERERCIWVVVWLVMEEEEEGWSLRLVVVMTTGVSVLTGCFSK